MVRKIPPDSPVSDELLCSIIRALQSEQAGKGMPRGVSMVEKGNLPSQIFFTSQGRRITCAVTEDSSFVYFVLPSGKFSRARKETFLDELCRKSKE
ncbi:MAG: hypothetical protein AABW93_00040 [Nanoarchaeota archaeon]